MTERELLSFENPIELAFVEMLAYQGFTNAFESRSVMLAESPWVECCLITGNGIHFRALGPSTLQSKGATTSDAWESQLQWSIKSLRESDTTNPTQIQHKRIVGCIRACMVLRNIQRRWKDLLLVRDLYCIDYSAEAGSQLSFDDQNNLDITTISFTIKHNIHSALPWPIN